MFILRIEVENALETAAHEEARRRVARWIARKGGPVVERLTPVRCREIVDLAFDRAHDLHLRTEWELAHAALAFALVADRPEDSPARLAVNLALSDPHAMPKTRVVTAVEIARSAEAFDLEGEEASHVP